MKSFNKKTARGFTIIEVMIVLAIAGLIMLIIFLAVPALQRNSRNNGIRNDAATVLGGVNEFVSNNSGQLPTTLVAAADGTVTVSGAAGTQSTTAKTRPGTTVTVSTTFPAANSATGALTVAFNNKCSGNTAFTANTRSTAIGFVVEAGGANAQQCVES